MTINRVTMFKCPETGKLFKTERGAENSAKRERGAKELSLLATGFDPSGFEAQQNYVRLNATSPQDIMRLVGEKAEEFWGLKVTTMSVGQVRVCNFGDLISFGRCTITVNSTGSCRLAYMAEQARIRKDKWYRVPSISNLLFGPVSGFKGFETGSGCEGRCGEYPLQMDVKAKIVEFPIIAERHGNWVTNRREYDKYEYKKSVMEGYGLCLARSSPEYMKLEELRVYHAGCEWSVVKPKDGGNTLLIEAKSAGDFTNTNKRRKEEAIKKQQIDTTYPGQTVFLLFLCGYFDCVYLGYEAAEGIDWVWEHRIDDLNFYVS